VAEPESILRATRTGLRSHRALRTLTVPTPILNVMHSIQAIAAPADHAAVVVDLIGDLDTTLGQLLADTLDRIAAAGDEAFSSRRNTSG